MKIYLLSIFGFLLLLFACKKESEPDNKKPSEVLTPGLWQLKQLWIESPPGSGPSDITAVTYDPCELDDVFEFKAGSVFSCSENSKICQVNSGIFYNLNGGQWSLTGDTLLTIAAGFNVQKFNFGQVTSNTMELQQTQANYLGGLTRYSFFIQK
jgi:hypothetical protein